MIYLSYDDGKIIADLKEEKISAYQMEMIKNNKIDNLLNFTLNTSKDKTILTYEINGLESLNEFLESNKYDKRMEYIVLSIQKILDNFEDYLLKLENIYYDAKNVYVDKDSYNNTGDIDLYFLYLPITSNEIKEEKAKFEIKELKEMITFKIESMKIISDSLKEKNLDENMNNKINVNIDMNKKIYNETDKITDKINYKIEDKNKNKTKTKDEKQDKLFDKFIEKYDQIEREDKLENSDSELKLVKRFKTLVAIITCILLFILRKSMLNTIITLIAGVCAYLLIIMLEKILLETGKDDYDVNDETMLLTNYPYLKKGLLDDKVIISSDEFVIGKSNNVNLSINNSSISKRHAIIMKKKFGYYIKDLNSTNSTYVNEIKLEKDEERMLSNGDKIRFASTTMQFVCDN